MRRPTTEDQAQRIMTDNMLLLGRNGSFRCHYVLGAAYLAVMGATWESFNVESKASELAGALSENSDIGGAPEHYNHRVCLAFDFFAMT